MYFTEGEVQEMRTRLPLVTISVVDSLVSYSASSALSANQGRVLGERVSFLEGRISALLHIETVHPWTGDSGIYSMVSAPDDTLNNVTNARVAYELKKRTDDLASRVTAIEAAIQSMSGGGGGGGTYILPVASDVTLGGVKIGSNSGLSIDAYGNLSVTGGGGGGTGGGWIGTTAVQANQTSGQNLTGIGNATLSGNLSVAGTSTLTGNVFVAGAKIYFGSSTAAPYLEYNSNGFHFSHGVYSDSFVSAGGIGSGGGGGTGDDTWRPVYVGGSTQQYKVLDSSTSNPLVFTGNGVVWDNESSSVKIDANPNSVLYTPQSLTSAQQLQARTNINAQESFLPTLANGYLKYTAGAGWSFDSSTSGVSVVSDWTGNVYKRVHVGSVNGVDFYAPKDTDSWRNVYAYDGGTYREVLSSDSSDSLKFDENDFAWSQSSGIYLRGGGSPSSDSWRPMMIKSTSSSSSSVLVDSSASNQYGTLEFCGGTNVTLSSSTTTTTGNAKVTRLTINSTGSSGGGSSVSISNLLSTGTRIATINVDGTDYDIKAPSSSGNITITQLGNYGTSTPIFKYNTGGNDVTIYGPSSSGSGSTVSWTPVSNIPSSWTQIGTLTIDGTNNVIKAPSASASSGVSSVTYIASSQSSGWTTIGTLSVTTNGTQESYTLKAPTSQGVSVGALNTDNSSALSVNSSESFSNTINLHKISKTGNYSDLLNRPTLEDISNGTTRKLPMDIRVFTEWPLGNNNDLDIQLLVYDVDDPTTQQPIFGDYCVIKHADSTHAGIVDISAQSFGGDKTFVNNLIAGSKLYIGNTAPNYYFEYNSTDKCLHLYCGTGVSGSGTKLKIHGNVDIDGDVAVTGDIVANGSVTAGA